RCHARARSCAAVEPLRRAAVAFPLRSFGHVGHVSPAGQAAVAQRLISPGLVVRRGGSQAARRGSRLAGRGRRRCEGRPIATALEARGMPKPAPAALPAIFRLRAPMSAAADGAKHGLSAFGELKYPPDFKHFEWVNPDAPKGGRLATIGVAARGTFDSFNAFILKGDAAQGLEYLFDTLMVRAFDEPDAVYGLAAASAEVAPDRSLATFRLRPQAKFADGSALTADDVVFAFNVLKEKGHPIYRAQLRDVTRAEILDPLTVRYTFTGTETRDLPLVAATLPILSKAYYATREFDQTT